MARFIRLTFNNGTDPVTIEVPPETKPVFEDGQLVLPGTEVEGYPVATIAKLEDFNKRPTPVLDKLRQAEERAAVGLADAKRALLTGLGLPQTSESLANLETALSLSLLFPCADAWVRAKVDQETYVAQQKKAKEAAAEARKNPKPPATPKKKAPPKKAKTPEKKTSPAG